MNAPTMLAPIIVRPPSVLNHFGVTGPGLPCVIALIRLLAPSPGSPVRHARFISRHERIVRLLAVAGDSRGKGPRKGVRPLRGHHGESFPFRCKVRAVNLSRTLTPGNSNLPEPVTRPCEVFAGRCNLCATRKSVGDRSPAILLADERLEVTPGSSPEDRHICVGNLARLCGLTPWAPGLSSSVSLRRQPAVPRPAAGDLSVDGGNRAQEARRPGSDCPQYPQDGGHPGGICKRRIAAVRILACINLCCTHIRLPALPTRTGRFQAIPTHTR
jgi:hypothetical protein